MQQSETVCDKCGVEIIQAKSRSERFAHIKLALPVTHVWFIKDILPAVLDMSTHNLKKVIYFKSYIVTDPGDTPLKHKDLLSDEEYRIISSEYNTRCKVGTGAEAIRELLKTIDLSELCVELNLAIKDASSITTKTALIKRLKIVKKLKELDNKPETMILDVIPILPPDLRPEDPFFNGDFPKSDLNELYQKLITRRNRCKRLMELNAPSEIIRNETWMIQVAVDAIFDNGRSGRAIVTKTKRPLKSLSDMLALTLLTYQHMLPMPNKPVKRLDLETYYAGFKFGRLKMTPEEISQRENLGEEISEYGKLPKYNDCIIEESIDSIKQRLLKLSAALAINISHYSFNFKKLLAILEVILSHNIDEIIIKRDNAELFNNQLKNFFEQYASYDIESLIPNINITDDSFYCIKEHIPHIISPSISFSRLTDTFKQQLRLIPGIGSSKEQNLKSHGYRTILDLLDDPRYTVHIKEVLELLNNKDYPSLKDYLSKRTILKSHPAWLVFSCFNEIHNWLFLEIEKLGKMPAPIILVGIAYFENGSLVIE